MRSFWAIAALAGVLVLPTGAAAKPRLLETVEVPPTGNFVKTSAVLQKEQVYIIEVSGFVTEKSGTSSDALYCFTPPSCPKPDRQLGTVGLVFQFVGPTESGRDKQYHLTDVARVRRIYYEPSHVYKERFSPRIDGQMQFASFSGEAGKFEVKIYAGGEFDLKMDTRLKPRLEKPPRGKVPPFVNTKEEVNPDFFEMVAEVKQAKGAKCPHGRYRFHIGKRTLRSEPLDDRCEFLVNIPEGVHRLGVRTGRGENAMLGEQEVVVQDWLIVGIGDSVASGEGNPDLPKRHERDAADWQSRRCHRSHNSHQNKAARYLETKDDDTSVTFLHLACSGASIENGLLGGYEGIEKGSATNLLAPQVSQFLKLVGEREVDAVVISIGANDLKFGPVLKHCVLHEACMDATFQDGMTLRDWVPSKMHGALGRLFGDLGKALAAGGIDADRVYITGYPELLRAADGNAFCGQVLRNYGAFTIDSTESEWLQTNFADPLNQTIFYNGLGLNRWGFVSDYVPRFRTHGYCAQASARWAVTQDESENEQGNNEGSMHPNENGHDVMGREVFKELKPGLYPKKDKPRMPRVKGEEFDEDTEEFLNS